MMPLRTPPHAPTTIRYLFRTPYQSSLRSQRRCYTGKQPLTPGNTQSNPAANVKAAQQQASSVERLINRLPKFTRFRAHALRTAPLSHISAFLILHELTAIIPLFGLVGAFHYYDWLPPGFAEGYWVKEGTLRFGKWMRKRGWISEEEKREAGEYVEQEAIREEGEQQRQNKGWRRWIKQREDEQDVSEEAIEKKKKNLVTRAAQGAWGQVADKDNRSTWWGRGEGGVRLVVEFATAYAVVKAFMIPRVLFSIWGTPWFARVAVEPIARRTVTPIWTRLKGIFGGRKGSGPPSPGPPASG
ncbi:hypothetical protein EJ05DRAFT_479190 [Pseudovirgaria hyperparasitica]|uniref:Uncharacterized protein n=1 Tax=Pseudovirgaria hyperparasitica TaxID=470096 RepID=A0A6A6VY51_9PEZI|nr:uncharacterized protein EJ05DRAFT_479190 [Pseudovirgaria hyperparasitica]KAF2754769.1 hypothetical protein EJ05DRAFT_479190 [Pseudovirgaria hyperparasitica]